MARLLFHLNNVPDDEAEAVRELLNNAKIAFYETDGGRFGFSVAGIWLEDSNNWARARQLIDQYQQRRQQDARNDYERRKAAGELPSRWQIFKQSPIVMTIALIFVSALAWFSVRPFFG